MKDIKYNTSVFIDPKTKHIKIRVRWNKNETTFSLAYRADPSKWDSKEQRPIPGTIHKIADQNCTARIITNGIEESLDQIKIVFKKCEIESVVPSKDMLKLMIRGEQPKKEDVVVKKTLAELYEEFLTTVSDERNWTNSVHFKYQQTWKHLNACCPKITLEKLTRDRMRELKNWYVDNGYSNVTIKKMFTFLKTFIKWLKSECYEIQPGVLEYEPNLTVVPRTVTFLTYEELMQFYNFKYPENAKNLELARDMFCFMAFTSLRYSDLANLKVANVFEDRLEVCTQKTHDNLTIPLTIHAKEIIEKYKDQDHPKGKLFRVYANQKINELLKRAAEMAGLDRLVVKTQYKGTIRHEEVKKFHEIISCHDGRRTFVCCSLALGIPPTVVMSCTGHSTYKAMKPYIEVADETQKKEIAKWNNIDKQNKIRDDISKKLEDVDEDTLKKVLEILKSA